VDDVDVDVFLFGNEFFGTELFWHQTPIDKLENARSAQVDVCKSLRTG